jgi:GNAT superfamily N-acetyltransferase
VAEVLARVRDLGRPEVSWWVTASTAPAGLEEVLRERGGTVTEVVDVLAYDLGAGVPDLAVPPDVTATTVTEPRALLDWHRVAAAVWGTPEPPEGQVAAALAAVREERGRGELRVVGYVGPEPAAAAGCTLVGPVMRLWGAATLPAWRGRGAYRAVLGERLAQAHWRGATLALVKARVGSSGPILRAAGFAAYGQERCYTLPV